MCWTDVRVFLQCWDLIVGQFWQVLDWFWFCNFGIRLLSILDNFGPIFGFVFATLGLDFWVFWNFALHFLTIKNAKGIFLTTNSTFCNFGIGLLGILRDFWSILVIFEPGNRAQEARGSLAGSEEPWKHRPDAPQCKLLWGVPHPRGTRPRKPPVKATGCYC